MTKVFISYSRKDKVFAGKFTEALQKSELETWIDWEDIPPTADWMDQIHKGIEPGDAFLFLLSPDSVASKVCGQEVDYAVQNGKRLIPIVARDVNPNDVHPAMAKVNWIYCRETDDFDGAINKTLSAIRTDLAWVEFHRRLQVRAIEWDKRKDHSLLLRGKDLREAEEQLASVGQKDPQPTDLQRQYALESRRRESRTRNSVLVISAVVMIVLASISIFAVSQRNLASDNALTAVANQNVAQTAQADAEEQARIALSRQLAAQADAVREEDLSLSLLLSMESLNAKQTSEAKSALLKGLQVSPEAFVLQESGEPVVSLAYSPDKHILSSGCENGDIFLWDTSNLAVLLPLAGPIRGHAESINSMAFSPDSLVLASGGSDNSVLFWDVSNLSVPIQLGKPVREHTGDVILVSYRQYSQIFISVSSDSTVIFWDVSVPSEPTKIGTFNLGYAIGVESVAVSSDGRLLASAGDSDSIIRLWDISDPTAPLQFEQVLQGETEPVISIAFNQNGSLLASGSMDQTILFFDITDPANSRWIGEILDINTMGVSDITFGSDGKTLVTGSSEGPIYLWDGLNPRAPMTLSGHVNQVNSVIFDPSGSALASADQDGRIILWDIYTPYAPIKPETPLLEQTFGVQKIIFSPNGKKLVAAGGIDEPVILWDVSNPSIPLELGPLPAEQTKDAVFGEDGNVLMLVQDSFDSALNMALTIWDISNPSALKQTGRSLKFTNSVRDVTFNMKRKLAVSTIYDAMGNFTTDIVLWDISNPTEPIQLGILLQAYPGVVGPVKFSPFGNLLVSVVSGFDSENIIIWDISNPANPVRASALLQEQTGDIFNIAFSPTGDMMASWGSPDSVIRLWDISSPAMPVQLGMPLAGNERIKGLVAGPSSVAFNQEETILASGGVDSTILLWDITNPTEPRRLGLPLNQRTDGIIDITFNSDGLLATLDYSGNILLWDLNLKSWMQTSCTIAGRNLTRTEALLYLNDAKYEEHPTCAAYPVID